MKRLYQPITDFLKQAVSDEFNKATYHLKGKENKMREILFRAKALGTTQWVYGYYYREEPPLECFNTGKPKKYRHWLCASGFADWSMPRSMDMQEIDVETLGQYIGIKSTRTGEKIFEGDFVSLGLQLCPIVWGTKTNGFIHKFKVGNKVKSYRVSTADVIIHAE